VLTADFSASHKTWQFIEFRLFSETLPWQNVSESVQVTGWQ